MKEKIGSLCILLGLLATTLPAQSWSGDQAVALQVHDSKGHAVANARVVFTFQGIPGETGPDIVATDGNGRAVLAGLAPGPWQVEISHPDYLSYIAMVDVRRGKKPLVSASFLEAGGRSLSPVKVKFSKGDRQAASPVLEARQSAAPPAPVAPPESTPPPVPSTTPEQTPAASKPVSAPSPEPETEKIADATEIAAPEPEPEPAVPEPEPAIPEPEPAAPEPEPAVPEPEPAVPEPEPAVPEPVSEPVSQPETPVEAMPRTAPPAEPVKATPPPPEPEPAAPEPTKVEIEDAAEQVAAVELVVEEVAATPDPAPPVPEPETEQIPEVTEVVIADVAAAEPEAEIPVPQQPPVVAAPTRTAVAVPPPPDPGARITSHSDGSCQDCESAEWTLETSVAVPAGDPGSAGTCGTEILEAARVAMQGLSTSIQLELEGFIGPIANGTSQEAIRRVEPDLAAPFTGELAAYVGGTSSCQIVGLVLPKEVRFSRVRLAASDHDETGNCAPGQTCSIGDALWIGSTLVERGPSATVIYGLFENRSAERGRRAVLTAHYRPPNANWKPRLPAAE